MSMLINPYSFAAQMAVTPTTWNPSDKSANIVLSNGDRTAAFSTFDVGARSVYSINSATSNKFYWEVACNDTVNGYVGGLSTSSWSWVYNGSGTWSVRRTGGGVINKCGGGVDTSTGVSSSNQAGQIFMFAFTGGNLHVGVDGSWIGGSNPVANTGALWTGITGTVFASMACHNSGVSGSVTANFGNAAFSYSPPTGFYAGFGAPI